MHLVYEPEGQDPQRWEYRPTKIMALEAEALEKRTGMSFSEFDSALRHGSTVARRALLWLYLRRTHPLTKYENVDYELGELRLVYDRDELVAIRDRLIVQEYEDEAIRDGVVEYANLQIAEWDREHGGPPAEEPDPKEGPPGKPVAYAI